MHQDAPAIVKPAFNRLAISQPLPFLVALLLATLGRLQAAESTAARDPDRETVDKWSAPYRGWHYRPEHVIPAEPNIPGYEQFRNADCPCVYQLPGQPDKWFMSFIAFDGHGYNSFVAESTNLVQWTHPRLAMGFGPPGEFDFGGCVIGAFLYESYDVKAPRVLKRREGKYWTLYGCYPRQGGYELRPGYEGVASSDDGLTWHRAKNAPIQSVQDPDCGAWEKDCIYQPWLVEYRGRFFDFYNAANGGTEQTGLAFSTDLLHWMRYPANPVIRNREGGYDAQFASDPKVFRDDDHWTMSRLSGFLWITRPRSASAPAPNPARAPKAAATTPWARAAQRHLHWHGHHADRDCRQLGAWRDRIGSRAGAASRQPGRPFGWLLRGPGFREPGANLRRHWCSWPRSASGRPAR